MKTNLKYTTYLLAVIAGMLFLPVLSTQAAQTGVNADANVTTDDNAGENAVETLNELIETAKDGENGYRLAAEKTNNPDLKAHYQAMSQQRVEFADKLHEEVNKMGGEAETEGTVQGAALRGWMRLKDAAGSDDKGIVTEVKRAEGMALEEYNDALKTSAPLPKDTRSLVEKQRDKIQKAFDVIQKLDAKTSAGTDVNTAIKQSGVRLEKGK